MGVCTVLLALLSYNVICKVFRLKNVHTRGVIIGNCAVDINLKGTVMSTMINQVDTRSDNLVAFRSIIGRTKMTVGNLAKRLN